MPDGAKRSKVTFETYVDLGGSLPAWLVSMHSAPNVRGSATAGDETGMWSAFANILSETSRLPPPCSDRMIAALSSSGGTRWSFAPNRSSTGAFTCRQHCAGR